MTEEHIGKYRLIKQLGYGGFATVYQAEDTELGRMVAIKVLHPHLVAGNQTHLIERFYKEARIMASLRHRHIVTVHERSQTDDGRFYIVMEYLPGGTLQDRLNKQGALSLAETLAILKPLAQALDKAHAQGIVHRDLKAENIIFDEDNYPYLTDFGVARLMETVQTQTKAGTLTHMAPEQWRGEDLDLRTDVYQLGIVLFQMLTGRLPFVAEGANQVAYFNLHVSGAVPALPRSLPEACQGVVEKALAKEREARFDAAGELVAALADIVERARPDEIVYAETVPEVESVPLLSTLGSTFGKGGTYSLGLGLAALAVVAVLAVLCLAVGVPRLTALLPTATETPQLAEATSTPRPTNTPTPTLDPNNVPPPNPELGDEWTRPTDGAVLVYVPAGTFTMGSEDGSSNEAPEHSVTLAGFWLDQTEVTNAQYVLCLADGSCSGSASRSDDHPVVSVTWFEAEAYCAWAGGQLPTEAQWEYAARGDDGRDYPWDNDDSPNDSLLNYNQNERGTTPVGSYPNGASWVGALDMAGNVWEWVNDWYDSDYYETSPSENPAGPESGSSKVLRGGGWFLTASFVRSANRLFVFPSTASDNFGFRCVAVPGIR